MPIRLRLTTSAAGWDLDFTGSAGQRPGSINAVAAVTRSASYYVLRCLLPAGAPTNAGLFRPVRFTLPARSVVNAAPPAAVAAGNVETSQRIVDVVWGAIAQALPDRMPAASAGTMNNVAAGGIDPRSGESWAYYETSGGGLGGGPLGPGLEAVQSHMTNTLNNAGRGAGDRVPAAGAGEQRATGQRRRGPASRRRRAGATDAVPRAGDGHADRRAAAPRDRGARRAGPTGRRVAIGSSGRARPDRALPGKTTFAVEAGDIVSMETPGGGGWG